MAVKPVPNGDYQGWFTGLLKDKPFNQQTLLDLEPTLNEYGVQLTPPNANGDRTKIGIPDGKGGTQWVRVGFGEGTPVWVPQGTTTTPSTPQPSGSSTTTGSASGPSGEPVSTILGQPSAEANIPGARRGIEPAPRPIPGARMGVIPTPSGPAPGGTSGPGGPNTTNASAMYLQAAIAAAQRRKRAQTGGRAGTILGGFTHAGAPATAPKTLLGY